MKSTTVKHTELFEKSLNIDAKDFEKSFLAFNQSVTHYLCCALAGWREGWGKSYEKL